MKRSVSSPTTAKFVDVAAFTVLTVLTHGGRKMKSVFCALIAASVVALGISVMPTVSFAECTGTNRVLHSDADCMEADWLNDAVGGHPRISHRNSCKWIGTMGVLVDYTSGADLTEENTGEWLTKLGRYGATVDNMYCCKDMGDEFCDRVDVLTDAWCSSEFEDSPASSSCTVTTATADTTAETCAITASCTYNEVANSTSMTVDMAKADNLKVCIGLLTLQGC